MQITFEKINGLPYLLIMDGQKIWKADVIVNRESFNALYDYYLTLLASIDNENCASIDKDRIPSIEKYAKEKLSLETA